MLSLTTLWGKLRQSQWCNILNHVEGCEYKRLDFERLRSGMRDMRGSHGTPGIKDVLEGRGINKSHRERTNYNKQHWHIHYSNEGNSRWRNGEGEHHLISILFVHIRTWDCMLVYESIFLFQISHIVARFAIWYTSTQEICYVNLYCRPETIFMKSSKI